MSQDSIVLNTTPPYPGADLVNDVNKALQTLGTDFAGATDPATIPGSGVAAYMTWADAGNNLIKRRNAANADWVVEGDLFIKPLPMRGTKPSTNVGPYSSLDGAVLHWDGILSAYSVVGGIGGNLAFYGFPSIPRFDSDDFKLGGAFIVFGANSDLISAGYPNLGLGSNNAMFLVVSLGSDVASTSFGDHIYVEVTGMYDALGYMRKFRRSKVGSWGRWVPEGEKPIGSQYTQYPGMDAPATLFGGTWQLQFATEGVFFRTEGGNASAFGSGIQMDALQDHTHSYFASKGPLQWDGAGGSGAQSTVVMQSGSSEGARIANETRGINRTYRIWKKTAH